MRQPAPAPLLLVSPLRALAGNGGRAVTDQALLFSDAGQPGMINRIAPSRFRGHRLRIWWNGADEIVDFTTSTQRSDIADETNICFFGEVAASVRGGGLNVLEVPYAFSRPRPRSPGKVLPSICFTAEVDISDDVLSCVGDPTSLSGVTWDLAKQVVDGTLSIVQADSHLAAAWAGVDVRGYRAALWALRNRVRYLLVKVVIDAFGLALVLRGTDWLKLGLPAKTTSRRTTFSRTRRMSDYRRHRVSLDLGSKSTHAMLYPRSADIMAAAGGIVQFHSGADNIHGLSALDARQVRTADGLVKVIDRLLTMDAEDVERENVQIHEEYAALRLQTGRLLADEIRSRCR